MVVLSHPCSVRASSWLLEFLGCPVIPALRSAPAGDLGYSWASEVVMWVRMGTFRVKPGMAETLVATYNERAVPKVRAVPGNLGCLLLEPKTSDDEFVVLTIWRDQAAAQSYESSGGAAEVVALVRECFAGPPSLSSYFSRSHVGLGNPAS